MTDIFKDMRDKTVSNVLGSVAVITIPRKCVFAVSKKAGSNRRIIEGACSVQRRDEEALGGDTRAGLAS